jgi:hypothetical protein
MFLIRGVWHVLVAILNPVHPWDNVAHRRAPVTHAIAVNIVQLMIAAVLIERGLWLLEWVF